MGLLRSSLFASKLSVFSSQSPRECPRGGMGCLLLIAARKVAHYGSHGEAPKRVRQGIEGTLVTEAGLCVGLAAVRNHESFHD